MKSGTVVENTEKLHKEKRGRADKIRRSALNFCKKWVPVNPCKEMVSLRTWVWAFMNSMDMGI